jgi:two-component system, NarL family, sensor histidine kinase DesK
MPQRVTPDTESPLLTVGVPGRGDRRYRLQVPFVAVTLFFTLAPLVSVLSRPPQPAALALLLAGWAIFGLVLVRLFRLGPFATALADRWIALAAVALAAIALVAQLAFGVSEATALYFYAGVTAARLESERGAVGIALVALVAALGTGSLAGDWADGLTLGVTVATISLTIFALTRLGRANRELQAARRELADLAVAEERARIARDLHDTLGHSLSVIALKAELARRVLPDDPARAGTEIGDVERVAREALASVRETVSGYRQPTLAMELAGARAALAAAGIDARVEPAPEDLPRDVDAVLGWAVREGTTNVLRHSDAAHAHVRVVVGNGEAAVEVEDDGRMDGVADPAGEAPSPGTGLVGLRERAVRLGGGVEAGPLASGGFRLRVAVPVLADGAAS